MHCSHCIVQHCLIITQIVSFESFEFWHFHQFSNARSPNSISPNTLLSFKAHLTTKAYLTHQALIFQSSFHLTLRFQNFQSSHHLTHPTTTKLGEWPLECLIWNLTWIRWMKRVGWGELWNLDDDQRNFCVLRDYNWKKEKWMTFTAFERVKGGSLKTNPAEHGKDERRDFCRWSKEKASVEQQCPICLEWGSESHFSTFLVSFIITIIVIIIKHCLVSQFSKVT